MEKAREWSGKSACAIITERPRDKNAILIPCTRVMQCGIINLGKRNSYLVHSRALQCNINCYKESSSSECQPIRWWSEMNFNHLRQDAATTGPWRNEPLARLPRVQSGEQVQADVNSPSRGPDAAPRLSRLEATMGSTSSLLTGWVVSAHLEKAIIC